MTAMVVENGSDIIRPFISLLVYLIAAVATVLRVLFTPLLLAPLVPTIICYRNGALIVKGAGGYLCVAKRGPRDPFSWIAIHSNRITIQRKVRTGV